ncbi:MAG TPA: NF038122 family metalloprotease, partial [Blastocatellia bacterium]|nr:NF038122 family metalloprotease [Blastocatellia bacterium]
MARTVYSSVREKSIAVLALIVSVGLLAGASARPTKAARSRAIPEFHSAASKANVLYQSDDGIGCRNATSEEVETLAAARASQTLSVISPVRTHDQNGLSIILRSTAQLDSVPEARAAFTRIAALWQSVISTPITVVIDVDFGPTWFGQAYPQGIAGLTNPQLLVGTPIYPYMQQHLIDGASSAEERALYYSLPQIFITTDLGDTDTVVGPSSLFRALDFIAPIAVPALEPGIWGPPPAIGFNSSVAYDFDPTDGVDAGKEDFEAAVSHEIGHVLGFVSYTGLIELDSSQEIALSVWDLFRMRPGSPFSTGDRILSSGGSQVYFAGGASYPLSTGRPDGTGGDGQPASHWKDDKFSGDRIGIMDPTIPQGKRQTITLKDLAALDKFGYTIRPFGNTRPVISGLTADIRGDVLSVRATLTDIDGDPSLVQVGLIDEDNQLVSQLAPTAEDFGIATKTLFARDYPGISSVPSVMRVSLVVADTRGNLSAAAFADVAEGDPGGPRLSTASYNKGRLNIKGKKFGGQPQIEINGQIVAPASGVSIGGSNKKLIVEADGALLNLR